MAKENHLSYKPSKRGAEYIEELRQKFIELDDLIDNATAVEAVTAEDESACRRAKAVSKTHLEDARMWAIQSVVRLYNEGPAEYQGTVSGSKAA